MKRHTTKQLNKKVVSFALPVDLIETIKELAGKEKKSGSKVVEELIRESLNNRKRKKLGKIVIHSETLECLKGIISLGGDALKDSEAIYE